MPKLAKKLIAKFWPGGLTVIVPRKENLPELISTTKNVGIRMPDHPVALQLLQTFGPLATTSANLSGGTNPQSAIDVFDQLNGRVPLILNGGVCPGGIPSTVVDCTGEKPVVLRLGAISEKEILAALEE